jgi:uncharacterized protein (DUF2267 family)
MPVPMELRRGSEDFERLLATARDIAGLSSTHQAYTMIQGVLQTFRRRLSPKEAIRFASVLPPVLRAIFIEDWDLDEPKLPFLDRESMTREAQTLRKDHNFSPDSCIRDVAVALRRNIDEAGLERVLADLSPGARDFWRI